MLTEADSCLFVTAHGTLIQVFCTFKVVVLEDVNTLRQGDIVSVSEVKVSTDGMVVYEIGGDLYYFYHFALLL